MCTGFTSVWSTSTSSEAGSNFPAAGSHVQIDRYSGRSGTDVAVSYLDDSETHAGWKTTFGKAGSWVRFNEVDFGRGGQRSVEMRAKAPAGGVLEIRLDREDGPVLARVEIGRAEDWKNATIAARNIPGGVHDLIVTQAGAGSVDVDWVSFR